MASISLKNDIDELTRRLTNIEKKQIPFASSLAINNTANIAKEDVKLQMIRLLDNPTPFTRSGVAVIRSSKRNLTAKVLIKDIQAEYLKYAVFGGENRKQKSRPANIKLNKFGNIPSMKAGKKINALSNKNDMFVGTVRGVNGVWQRVRRTRKLKLIIRFVNSKHYKKGFPFHAIVIAESKRRFSSEFNKALDYALSTAK